MKVTSKMSRSPIVLTTITALYLLNVAQTAVQWKLTSQLVGLLGEPLQEAFIFAVSGPRWTTLVNDLGTFLTSTLADVLLVRHFFSSYGFPFTVDIQIWRCYHIWDDSLRAILLPVVLLLAEVGTCNTPLSL